MNLGPCPTCGYNEGVYQKMRVTGSTRQYWNDIGQRRHLVPTRTKHTPHSDAVRCAVCRHIRRDWQAVDGELVRGE